MNYSQNPREFCIKFSKKDFDAFSSKSYNSKSSIRAYSSAWSERLSYKQEVPSSNLGRLIEFISISCRLMFINIKVILYYGKGKEKSF